MNMLNSKFRKAVDQRFKGKVCWDIATRGEHCNSPAWEPACPPDAVVFAENVTDIQEFVLLCSRYQVPIIPFGAGTSLEGQVNAINGGIALSTARMNQILEISPRDLYCRVQSGVTRESLNDALATHSLFFSVDPGANASLGGMASTRASGTTSVAYGTMKENVMAMVVVLPDGQTISVGNTARKSAFGLDLLNLFIGAEGTLGVIVEITLRVRPTPKKVATGISSFQSFAHAIDAVVEVMREGLRVARIELLDETCIDACNAYSQLHLPSLPTLFWELHTTDKFMADEVEQLKEIVGRHQAVASEYSCDPLKANTLWAARHDAWWALHNYFPDKRGTPTDVCVPLSKFSECILRARSRAQELNLVAPLIGHVGDGNFHMLLLTAEDDHLAQQRAKEFIVWLGELAVSLGGTCSGEHGVGHGKLSLMAKEHGNALELMQKIKMAIDPKGILNPGKLIPPTSSDLRGAAES